MENRFLLKNRIFSSRLLLTLEEKNIFNGENGTRKNINFILSLICLIFQTVNIILAKHNEVKFISLGLMLYTSTSVNLAIIILSILHFFSLVSLKYSDFFLTNLIFGTNYICLEINILFILSYFNILVANYPVFIFISSFIFSFKLTFFTIVLKYSLFTFIFLILILSLEVVVVWQSAYFTSVSLLSFILNNVFCFLASYLNKLDNSLDLFLHKNVYDYLKNDLEDSNFLKRLFDCLGLPLFRVNLQNGNIYFNQAMMKIMNIKSDKKEEETVMQLKLQENIRNILNQNKFNLFISNQFYTCPDRDKNEHKRKINEKLKNLFDSLILDEELANINNKLYMYLDKSKNSHNFDFNNFLAQFELEKEIETNNNKSINFSHNYLKSEVTPIVEDAKRESIFKINNDASKSLTSRINSEKILIGKTNLNANKINSEFLLYYIQIGEDLILSLETPPINETREMSDIVKILKAIYLSKISHEIKNPICLLLEIIANVKKDVDELEKFFNQQHEYQKGNSMDDSSSEDSEEIKTKKNFIPSTLPSFVNNFKNNLLNLNCISEMLYQVVNDFGFYSSSMDEVIQQSKTPNTFETHSPTEKRTISTPLIRKLSEKFHSKLFNNKDCKYKDIIEKIIQLFRTKINIENKLAKLEFEINMSRKLPDSLDIEDQTFQSLIFNLIYFVYKSVASGKLDLKIYNESCSSTYITNISNMGSKVFFEMMVRGFIADTNLPSSPDCVSFKKENNSSDERVSMKSNSPKESVSSNLNNMNILQICKIKNNTERNAVIDDFNNKFNYNLAVLYAKKLGVNLVFEKINKQHLNISFSLNYTNKKEAKNKSIINISSQTDSRRKSHNFSKTFENDFKESTIGRLRTDSIDSNTYENYITILPSEISEFKKRASVKISNSSNNRLNFNSKILEEDKIYEETLSEKCTDKQWEDLFVPSDSKRTQNYKETIEFKYEQYIGKEKFIENLYLAQENDKQESTLFKSKIENIDNTHEAEVTKREKPNSSPNLKPEALFKKRNTFNNKSSLIMNGSPVHRKRMSHVIFNTPKDKLLNPQINNTIEIKKPIFRRNPTMTSSTPTNKESIDRFKDEKSPHNDDIFRVLLCDDESLIRKTLHRYFNMLSSEEPNLMFEVEHSDNGFECLDLIYKHYCMRKHFDLIVIDETMPFFRGSQITNLLKTMIKEGNFKDIIIVSFTSYNCEEKIDYIFSQGANFVLNKPIKYEEFRTFFFDNILNTES